MLPRVEKHYRGEKKSKSNGDGSGWRILTQIAKDELEKFKLNFSRWTNLNVAPLSDVVMSKKETVTVPLVEAV